MNEIETCSICKGDIEQNAINPYWTKGSNAQPVNDGNCCDICDTEVVIPSRLFINGHIEGRKRTQQGYTRSKSDAIRRKKCLCKYCKEARLLRGTG